MNDRPNEHPEARRCLDRLQLDRLLAGEQTGLARAREHLEQCERCASRLAELQQRQAAMLSEGQVGRGVDRILAAAAQTERPFAAWRRFFSPLVWAPAAAAIIAGVALLVVLARPHPREASDAIRVKGAASLQVLLVGERGARSLADSDRLRSGDRLAFRVSSSRAATVLLVSLDAAGAPNLLALGATNHWPVQPGDGLQLPITVELDDATGDERVFAFFCDRPPATGALARQVERAYPRGPGGRRDLLPDRLRDAEGCRVRSALIRRAAR